MDISNAIIDFLTDRGNSAADITHKLKMLGNGNMQRGCARIAAFFEQDTAIKNASSRRKGQIEGGFIGCLLSLSLVGVSAVVIHLKQQKRKKNDHEADGQVILKTLHTETDKKSVTPHNNSDNSSTEDII